MVSTFSFVDTIAADEKTLVVKIPSQLSTFSELYAVLKSELGLPDYFGENLDALSDCLRDLHWVEQEVVLFVHNGIPFSNERSRQAYLSILRECVMDWERDQPGRLQVQFGTADRERVEEIAHQVELDETAGQ
jgi:RNAse (barnase) inhibitor barstar